MATAVRSYSACSMNEESCYESIKTALQKPLTQAKVDRAQAIYDQAMDDAVWVSPLGDASCSFDTHFRSSDNYCIKAKRVIEAARSALYKVK